MKTNYHVFTGISHLYILDLITNNITLLSFSNVFLLNIRCVQNRFKEVFLIRFLNTQKILNTGGYEFLKKIQLSLPSYGYRYDQLNLELLNPAMNSKCDSAKSKLLSL